MISPSETTELMKNLKQLSEVDKQLTKLSDRKVALNGQITSLESEIDTRKQEIDEKLKNIKEASHQEHRDEVLLKETEKEIRKVQTQLNTAQTNEELRIFKKKRRELEEKISELEDAILAHLTELDRSKEEVEASRKLLVERETQASGQISELRKEIAQSEQEHDTYSERRGEIASRVPSYALNKYERVLAKEKLRPVVEVRDKTCQGCFMKVTLQEINRIWRGEDLVLCRNCNRILCLPEEDLNK